MKDDVRRNTEAILGALRELRPEAQGYEGPPLDDRIGRALRYKSLRAPDPKSLELLCNCRLAVNPRTGEMLEFVAANRGLYRVPWISAGEKQKGRDAPGDVIGDGENWLTNADLPEGFEVPGWYGGQRGQEAEKEKDPQRRSLRVARARAKKTIREYALCTEFDTFITLTLDRKKIDRYDATETNKRLGEWLDNRVRRNDLRYLIVPERHKDGAVHYHGLGNEEALKLTFSGRFDRRSGEKIYNVADWPLGFSTAEKLTGDYSKVVNYVRKYITKMPDDMKVGGRYYLHGGAVNAPVYLYYTVDFDEMQGLSEYEVPDAAGLKLKFLDAGLDDCGDDIRFDPDSVLYAGKGRRRG